MSPDHYRSPRQEFRSARVRSQTVIFGSAIIGLAVLFLLGFLGITGALPVPFGGEFSKKEIFAEVGDTPCPTPGARAASPEGVSLRVLNTTSTPGLAGQVANAFEVLGYTIAATDNAPQYHGVARIEAGPRAVDAAYAIARYFPGEVRIVLSSAEDMTLTILLGNKYDGLVPQDERPAIRDSNSALVPRSGCLPVAEPADGWELPQSAQSGAQSDAQSGEETSEED
ncbi:LytR C-terminal domain-containing protein [Actinomyces minihominis]|uniref:LytR C-terminal domain-containing protein n=1 Tax=Actinomyces minihominis TaxID=2002838 RepID=UPI0013E9BF8F|nr:LytR C-terminal domain-containing protein [Actinomyces minihominis]